MKAFYFLFVSTFFLLTTECLARWVTVPGACARCPSRTVWVDDNPMPRSNGGFSNWTPSNVVSSGGNRSCATCPIMSDGSNMSSGGTPSENPRRQVNSPDGSRVTSTGGVALPQNAAEYQWDLKGNPHFFDKEGKEIDKSGAHVSGGSATGSTSGSGNGGSSTDLATARATSPDPDSCRAQASDLPLKLENGKLTLDPTDPKVKKFIAANAPNALPQLLSSMFGESDTIEQRLDKMKSDSKFKDAVTNMLNILPWDGKGEPPAEVLAALNAIFGLKPGTIIADKYPYGIDGTKLKELPQADLQFMKSLVDEKGNGTDVWTKYKESVFGSAEEKWKNFCFVCTFHDPTNAELVRKALGEDTKKLATK